MTTLIKVLVVDDEPQIRRALSLNLGARGYEVFEADSGERALLTAAAQHPDVVLLDLGLGGMDGTMVIEGLRGWSEVPIIVLTARDDERSKVLALDAGADDYVTKPFGMAELLARLRATMRRATPADIENPRCARTTSGSTLRRDVRSSGQPETEIRLTPIEWNIATYLVRHAERLVTYKQLIAEVWGPNYEPDQNLLRVHMAHIRRKLEADPSRPAHFITDSGMGYRYAP